MKAIVLAAGKGKRLLSEQYNLPKVLREANGRSLINYVLENIRFIPEQDTVIVAGYKKELLMEAVEGSYVFVSQDEQLGTGHAVMMTQPVFEGYSGDILILYGDMPLFKVETYKGIIEQHQKSGAQCTILTAIVENPPDYGRIIRSEDGKFAGIIEKKDCTQEELKIKELNVGIYVFDSKVLFESLKELKNDNSQQEYYLTDVPKIMLQKGLKIDSYTIDDINQIYGVNTPEELKLCERIFALS